MCLQLNNNNNNNSLLCRPQHAAGPAGAGPAVPLPRHQVAPPRQVPRGAGPAGSAPFWSPIPKFGPRSLNPVSSPSASPFPLAQKLFPAQPGLPVSPLLFCLSSHKTRNYVAGPHFWVRRFAFPPQRLKGGIPPWVKPRSQKHRIAGAERHLRRSPSPTPLEQVTQEHVQVGLECIHRGRIHTLPRQLLQSSATFHGKKCFDFSSGSFILNTSIT